MTIQDVYDYCLSKQGATEHFPFDDDTLAFKVGGKIFCLTSLKRWEAGDYSLNLKCDPHKAILLRAQYDGVVPGYHMNKMHWNTVQVNHDVPANLVKELIDESYNLVRKHLSKQVKRELDL